VQELVDGYLIIIGQLLHFIQANGFFATDAPVSTIVADIEQTSYIIYKRDMRRQNRFDLLKEQQLRITYLHAANI
jgi:hypothetical protein